MHIYGIDHLFSLCALQRLKMSPHDWNFHLLCPSLCILVFLDHSYHPWPNLGLITKGKFTWCKHANFWRRDSRKLAGTERNLVHSACYLVFLIIFLFPLFDPAAQTTTFLNSRSRELKEHHCQEHKAICKGLQPQACRLISISRAGPLIQCRTP